MRKRTGGPLAIPQEGASTVSAGSDHAADLFAAPFNLHLARLQRSGIPPFFHDMVAEPQAVAVAVGGVRDLHLGDLGSQIFHC